MSHWPSAFWATLTKQSYVPTLLCDTDSLLLYSCHTQPTPPQNCFTCTGCIHKYHLKKSSQPKPVLEAPVRFPNLFLLHCPLGQQYCSHYAALWTVLLFIHSLLSLWLPYLNGFFGSKCKCEWKTLSRVTTLCNPIDYTVHGILQARILKWAAFPFSRGSSQPKDWTQVSHIAGRFFTSWAPREAQEYWSE